MGEHIKVFFSSEGGRDAAGGGAIENPFTTEQLSELGVHCAVRGYGTRCAHCGVRGTAGTTQRCADARGRRDPIAPISPLGHTLCFVSWEKHTLTGPLGTSMRAWMEQRVVGRAWTRNASRACDLSCAPLRSPRR